MARPRAERLSATDRPAVRLSLDSIETDALAGDTVLTALLLHAGRTGQDPFHHTAQAGFCLMGACQSCWVWIGDGAGHKTRQRACDTEIAEGMAVFTQDTGAPW